MKKGVKKLADDFSKKLIRMITTGQYRPEHNDPTINFLNFQKDFIVDDYAKEHILLYLVLGIEYRTIRVFVSENHTILLT